MNVLYAAMVGKSGFVADSDLAHNKCGRHLENVNITMRCRMRLGVKARKVCWPTSKWRKEKR